MLKITQGKGFHMTFQNGYTVSVQWGAGNYCSNRSSSVIDEYETPAGRSFIQSEDAEVAVLFLDEFCTKQIWERFFHRELGDDVAGYVHAEEVAKILAFVSNL